MAQLIQRGADLVFELFEAVEDGIDAVHGGAGSDLLGAFTEGIELLFLLGVFLDVGFLDGVILSHDEEENWAPEALGFVELQLGDGELVRVPHGVLRRLAVFEADHSDVGGADLYHLK